MVDGCCTRNPRISRNVDVCVGDDFIVFFDFFNKKCNFFVKLFGESKKSCTFVSVFSK